MAIHDRHGIVNDCNANIRDFRRGVGAVEGGQLSFIHNTAMRRLSGDNVDVDESYSCPSVVFRGRNEDVGNNGGNENGRRDLR